MLSLSTRRMIRFNSHQSTYSINKGERTTQKRTLANIPACGFRLSQPSVSLRLWRCKTIAGLHRSSLHKAQQVLLCKLLHLHFNGDLATGMPKKVHTRSHFNGSHFNGTEWHSQNSMFLTMAGKGWCLCEGARLPPARPPGKEGQGMARITSYNKRKE